MNFQYYINYIAIVEEGSLTAAAHKVRVAQPALSNQIKALEEVYGTRLFHRGSGSHKLELTDPGRILYEKAKIMAEAEAAARAEIGNCFSGSSGSLRLGIADSLGTSALMQALNTFSERYPNTEIMLHEAKMPDLLKMLQNGVVDAISVRASDQKYENFDVVLSMSDDLVACYRENAFFMGNDNPDVSVFELSKFPLCVTEDTLPLLRPVFRDSGCMLTPRFVGSNLHSCLLWAQTGKGVALVPRHAPRMFGFDDLLFKSIAGAPITIPSLSLLSKRKQYRSRVINDFIEICAELYDLQFIRLHHENDPAPITEGE